jgi:hypothetical protein
MVCISMLSFVSHGRVHKRLFVLTNLIA